MTAGTPTPAKRALFIGIDAYQRLTPLEGCANDVRLMRSILEENFGFPPENMSMLVNEQATRDAILTALDAFVDGAGQNDIVVIHYAGHGSLMTDREADEPSGYDSTIMPVDSEGWKGDNRDITDDEIHLRLLRLGEKTPYTTLIFDCCHSGTITRDEFGEKSRSMPPDRRPVADLPPSPIPAAQRSAARESGPSGWMPLADKYVLIAGCRDEEVSYEYRPPEGNGKIKHGALTYFLSRELRSATPGTTYRDVFERAAANVNAANARQHPQMEGRTDREIFGVRDIEPMRFVRVTGRSGETATLGAGAALGITVGSKYSVYPQGTKSVEGVGPLGQIEVTAVRAVESDARITAESSAGAIVKGARAVETIHSWGELRLAAQLQAAAGFEPNVAQLSDALRASPLLKLVGDGEAAAARVYLLAARSTVGPGDPVPQLGTLTAPTWAAVREDGELMMPPKGLDAYQDVVRNLETVARFRQALALDNPDPNSVLRGKFDLELLRRASDGQWVVAEPEAVGGQIVFEEGDRIAFRVKSRHNEPVYVNLLDFGLSGAVRRVYPARGAQEMIRPGGFFEIFKDRGGVPLSFPKNFPFAEDPVHAAAAEGVETVKLIVTRGEADFGFLEQQGVRAAAARPSSRLMLLWDAATNGNATRDIADYPLEPEDDWTTVVRPFVLRRKRNAALQSGGQPVPIGSVTLTTPGLEGEVKVHYEGGRRAAAQLRAGELFGALEAAGVEVRQTIEIANAREVGPATRSAGEEPGMEISIRDPGQGFGQMLMTTDELGVISWHFAPPPEPAAVAARGETAGNGAARTYVIPRTIAAAPPGAAPTRGLVGILGNKLIKELVFPLVDPLIGAVSDMFAGLWEKKHRPYRLRTFTPDDYTSANAQPIDAAGWQRLGAGRALLLLHGTFSRAHSAFGSMPRDFVEELYRRYDGRVFALDHHTLSHEPRQNVNWLIDQLPGEIALDLDIICHSRGGLVGRVLSEKQAELSVGSRNLRVGRIIFAGSPNAGTILTDGKHMGDLLDTFTTVLNFFPDSGVGEIVSGIVTVAKQVAVGAIAGLRGLQAMRPAGDFATWLNTGPRAGETRYFAIASDFTPAEPGLRDFAKNRLMDAIFKGPNDLVVPTDGVFAENGSGFFPIEEKLVFSGTESVPHTRYFTKRAARDKIMEWLSA